MWYQLGHVLSCPSIPCQLCSSRDLLCLNAVPASSRGLMEVNNMNVNIKALG